MVYVQALNPLASGSGADGRAMTTPDALVIRISCRRLETGCGAVHSSTIEPRIGELRERSEHRPAAPDQRRALLDPLGGQMRRRIGLRGLERLARRHIRENDRPDVRTGDLLADLGVHAIARMDDQRRDERLRRRDELVPSGVRALPVGRDVLFGARLDEGVVTDGARGVDAAAADADPVRRVLGFSGSMEARRRDGPVAGD